MVAGTANTHDAGQNRRHATGGSHTLFRTFQRGQLVLKHGDGRVGKA